MVLISAALLSTSNEALSANPVLGRDISREWLVRPWEIRYVVFLAEARSVRNSARSARDMNVALEKKGREKVYLLGAELLEPTITFEVPGEESLAAVLIMFDPSGKVVSGNARLRRLTAKFSMLGRLVLTFDGSTVKRGYGLADWSQGIPGDDSFSPAICTRIDDARYADGWDKDDHYHGSFGCREWTAQLYNRAQPYIDVTSYSKCGSFIGKFVGWSRFTDPPKPIIGLQGKTWLCLLDCPVGEKPGIIHDITEWAVKHRFPVPTPPPTQPIYPNSNYKDDLSE
ncbi:hypothetical protein [Rugamonas sp. DEMB1]|uniref:hypothetical protein n=1 Tax=Rugamonas sp. DEMB1 TaxID=3039386 RepID=UPI00244B5DA4|nr:hypothetical protein [Rugamonas sp. DEMB1]WGG52941.1 hypothetical protein QC826_12880 [Rugamonas sp. DEMB1]